MSKLELKCSIATCHSTAEKGYLMIPFPPLESLRTTWAIACGLKDCENTDDKVICHRHFAVEDYVTLNDGKLQLRDDAVPTKFLKNYVPVGAIPLYVLRRKNSRVDDTLTGVIGAMKRVVSSMLKSGGTASLYHNAQKINLRSVGGGRVTGLNYSSNGAKDTSNDNSLSDEIISNTVPKIPVMLNMFEEYDETQKYSPIVFFRKETPSQNNNKELAPDFQQHVSDSRNPFKMNSKIVPFNFNSETTTTRPCEKTNQVLESEQPTTSNDLQMNVNQPAANLNAQKKLLSVPRSASCTSLNKTLAKDSKKITTVSSKVKSMDDYVRSLKIVKHSHLQTTGRKPVRNARQVDSGQLEKTPSGISDANKQDSFYNDKDRSSSQFNHSDDELPTEDSASADISDYSSSTVKRHIFNEKTKCFSELKSSNKKRVTTVESPGRENLPSAPKRKNILSTMEPISANQSSDSTVQLRKIGSTYLKVHGQSTIEKKLDKLEAMGQMQTIPIEPLPFEMPESPKSCVNSTIDIDTSSKISDLASQESVVPTTPQNINSLPGWYTFAPLISANDSFNVRELQKLKFNLNNFGFFSSEKNPSVLNMLQVCRKLRLAYLRKCTEVQRLRQDLKDAKKYSLGNLLESKKISPLLRQFITCEVANLDRKAKTWSEIDRSIAISLKKEAPTLYNTLSSIGCVPNSNSLKSFKYRTSGEGSIIKETPVIDMPDDDVDASVNFFQNALSNPVKKPKKSKKTTPKNGENEAAKNKKRHSENSKPRSMKKAKTVIANEDFQFDEVTEMMDPVDFLHKDVYTLPLS